MNTNHIVKIVFLALLLLILLAVNIGFIRWSVWFQLLKIFPVFLAALFLDFIFRYSDFVPLKLIPILLITAAAISVVYLSGAPDWFYLKQIKNQEISQTSKNDSVRSLDAIVSLNNGRFDLAGAGMDDIYQGSLAYYKEAPPLIETGQSGSQFNLALYSHPQTQYLFGLADGEHLWNLKLNDNIPTNLKIKSNYDADTLDFSNLPALNISVDSYFDDSVIKMGDIVDYARVSADINFSRARFVLPAWIGIRIKTNNKTTLTNVSSLGFLESDQIYTSPNYLLADKKIDVDISASVSLIEFQLYNR